MASQRELKFLLGADYSLIFGNIPVTPNLVLSTEDVQQIPKFSYPDCRKRQSDSCSQEELKNVTLLLLNLTKNKVYWLQTDTTIMPYTIPDEGTYVYYVFDDSTGITNDFVNGIIKDNGNNFTQNYKRTDLGEVKYKVRFYVKDLVVYVNSLLKLNGDTQRYLLATSNLSLDQINNLCASDPILKQNLCNNESFYKLLARYRIGENYPYESIKETIITIGELNYMIQSFYRRQASYLSLILDMLQYDVAKKSLIDAMPNSLIVSIISKLITNRNIGDLRLFVDAVSQIYLPSLEIYGLVTETEGDQKTILDILLPKASDESFNLLLNNMIEDPKNEQQFIVNTMIDYLAPEDQEYYRKLFENNLIARNLRMRQFEEFGEQEEDD
jgi:hypothetical protein